MCVVGAPWFQECEIQEAFQSPYLFPHFERFAVGKGCLSTETTSTGAQVHIINLRRGPPQIASSEGNKVILSLQPYIRTGIIFTWSLCERVCTRIHGEGSCSSTVKTLLQLDLPARLCISSVKLPLVLCSIFLFPVDDQWERLCFC